MALLILRATTENQACYLQNFSDYWQKRWRTAVFFWTQGITHYIWKSLFTKRLFDAVKRSPSNTCLFLEPFVSWRHRYIFKLELLYQKAWEEDWKKMNYEDLQDYFWTTPFPQVPAELFLNAPEGRRDVAWPKLRWDDVFKSDLKALRVGNQRTIAQIKV